MSMKNAMKFIFVIYEQNVCLYFVEMFQEWNPAHIGLDFRGRRFYNKN